MQNSELTKQLITLFLAVFLLTSCSDREEQSPADAASESVTTPAASAIGLIDEERINNADAEPGNWLAHGRTYEEQRYSPLIRVNKDTVKDLGLSWYKDMNTNRALEATPIVVDGTMFITSSWSRVYALDAVTGAEKWMFDPEVPREHGRKACCDVVNRGVAVYKGHVYFGSLDGRLFALNAETGRPIWEVDTIIDRSRYYTITGAPRVANDKVFIGNGGAEFGVRGYVTAYDANSGEEVWRFFTVPGDPAKPFENEAMEMAAASWQGTNYWEYGGGGTVWDGMAYDPEANLLYVGTGNGSPWNRDVRSPGGGDNLYLSSILALNPDNGELVWHYQTTPGDDWDYTATQPLMLLDLTIYGRERKVIVQAPKNGFFYVIDRLTGELISATPFADDLTWAIGVDVDTGRPIETPEARYGLTGNGVYLSPGPGGAHNWPPMSWNPATGLVYLPAQNSSSYYTKADEFEYRQGVWNTGIGRSSRAERPERPELSGPRTLLLAWDPAANTEAWRVVSSGAHGGTMSTGGNLLFRGAGDQFIAHDARTGEELWSATVGQGTGTPVAYELDGTQYVSIAAGRRVGRVYTFVLDGVPVR